MASAAAARQAAELSSPEQASQRRKADASRDAAGTRSQTDETTSVMFLQGWEGVAIGDGGQLNYSAKSQ